MIIEDINESLKREEIYKKERNERIKKSRSVYSFDFNATNGKNLPDRHCIMATSREKAEKFLYMTLQRVHKLYGFDTWDKMKRNWSESDFQAQQKTLVNLIEPECYRQLVFEFLDTLGMLKLDKTLDSFIQYAKNKKSGGDSNVETKEPKTGLFK